MSAQPVLPPELEREVFEATALMYCHIIPILMRVARRIHIWIEPFLYRVVRAEYRTQAIIDVLLNKSPTFCHLAVRHLALLDGSQQFSRDDAVQLLALCKGVTNLALGNSFMADPILIPILAEMALLRLAVSVTDLGCDLSHPLFSSVTHLILFDREEEVLLPLCAEIPNLASLTHLCLFFDLPKHGVVSVLAESSRLKLFLILWPPGTEFNRTKTPHTEDIRFVVGIYGNGYWDQWVDGAHGLPDYWTRGDALIAQKRNGEIEAARYWLE
ncbi:hypothetical protein C8F04DRAFT_1073469 [Mycena alexandri]|uniref:Uncharacterized protein n=1 Tax=Mycena alexandri TaxID=1745969 RepID=A0AAD6XCJ6_9AGAR|nr:hypothetical protein C8F04DRAFT_1073469 [Mycena alexandri]